jgi:hypothetical protein
MVFFLIPGHVCRAGTAAVMVVVVVVLVEGKIYRKVNFSNVIACCVEEGRGGGCKSFGMLERTSTAPSAIPFYLTTTIAPATPSARNGFLFW